MRRRQISSSRPAALVAAGRGRRRRSPGLPIEPLERRVLLSAYIVTNLNDSGAGSLRDTIQQANLHAGADTMTFAPGLRGTITLTTGELQITNDVAIIGPGPQYITISGNNISSVFECHNLPGPHTPLIGIKGLTFTRSTGAVVTSSATVSIANCDFIGNEYCISSFEGSLAITHCTFSGNAGNTLNIDFDNDVTVTDCSFAGNGGFGIINSGSGGALTIKDTSLSGNAGGLYDEPTSSGPVTLTNCVISGNKMNGVYSGARMAITSCNIADNLGIGIDNDGADLTLTDSTVSGNGSAGGAVGISSYQGGLTIVDSTICNNFGGGIASIDGSLTATNTTITSNTAQTGAGVWFAPFIGAKTGPQFNNTIVAANHDLKGTASDISIAASPGGPVTAQGSNNLIGPGGSGGMVNGKNGNILGVADANLHVGPLGDYGGRTQTIALLAGSPAIDHGSNSLAIGADGKPLLTDQRGFGRVFNGTVDIGAFEYGSSIPGDANGDGKVNFQDLVLLTRNYGHSGTWIDGDFNGDGKVAFDDLVILARTYGDALPTVTILATSAAHADVGGLTEEFTAKLRRREGRTHLILPFSRLRAFAVKQI